MKLAGVNELSKVTTQPCVSSTPGDWLYLVLTGEVPPVLDGKFVCPSDKQPIKESNTIADDLIERAIRSRVLGHRNVEIKLADEALLTLENKIDDLLSLKERKQVINDLIFMASFFPCSDPQKRIEVFNDLLKNERLRTFPSVNDNAHQMVLKALEKK